jgi:DNA polymerase-3 subunit alpha
MVEFASYSFNKSHAVAYTMISFWCMFLKQHYALEWFTAHLSHCAPGGYLASVKEAKAKGITVERPDINLSGRYFRIGHKWGTIISPLGVIKGLGDKAVGAILEAREKGGVFASLKDFEERVDRRLVNVRIRETLIRAGAFEGMGIVEPLKEVREKNYAELLPIFNEAPSIDREDRTALDKVALEILYSEMVGHCSAERSKSKAILSAKGGARPIIMVINNPVKGEVEHLTNKGTKFFLDAAREYGFTPADFYYTSPIKCFHPNPREVSKDCRARCLDFLKKEIAIVAPKLILCFSSDVLNMFVSDKKPTMGKLNGELVYNREFDTYVLFSYSPQYVYYGAVESDGSMTENFKKTISKMAEVFV